MTYWFEEQEERYCFVQESSKLANWRWEEVEFEEEEDSVSEEFLEMFED